MLFSFSTTRIYNCTHICNSLQGFEPKPKSDPPLLAAILHLFPFSQSPTRGICRYTIRRTNNQPPPLFVLSHTKLAMPKKGLRTPARLPAKPRRLQKSNADPGSAVKETPTCKLPWGSPLSVSILAHSIKSLMVQNDAVPTEFFGVGLFGFGFI